MFKNLVLSGSLIGCFFLGGTSMKLLVLKQAPSPLTIFNFTFTSALVVGTFFYMNKNQ